MFTSTIFAGIHSSSFLGKVLMVMGLTVGAVCALVAAYYIIRVIANWRVFKKAGEPGWKSLIPIYNRYIVYKIAWRPGIFWLNLLLSFVSAFCYNYGLPDDNRVFIEISAALMAVALAIGVVATYKLSRAFGHGVPFTLGLLFLNPLFILILGLGPSEYRDAASKGQENKEI